MAEKAIEFWRALDLVGLQKDLDKDAEEIGKRRDGVWNIGKKEREGEKAIKRKGAFAKMRQNAPRASLTFSLLFFSLCVRGGAVSP